MLTEKGKEESTRKASDSGHQRELRSGICLSPAPLGHEGAQAGNVLALQTETSLGTRETIHQATKA